MKKKKLQISIPEPCDQKFKDMTPTEGGRHCAQCDKVLVDFSVLTDKEIVEVVKNNKGKLCGHFRKSQLNRDISLVSQRVNSTRGKTASLLLTSMLSGGILEGQSKLLFPQSIENQEIVIHEKTLVDDFLEKEKEEKITIHGNVIDDIGEVLIGANILIKGTAQGTATDIDGNFTLHIPINTSDINPILIVSYTGYSSIEIEISSKSNNQKEPIIITLKEGMYCGGMVGIIITEYTNYDPMVLPHWEPEGNWLLDIEKGIKKLAQKFRTKRKTKKEKKYQKQLSKSVETIPSKETTKILKIPTLSYSTKINNVFPNPFLTEINVDFYSEKNNELEITVSDVSERVVYLSNENILLGNNQIKINISETSLQNGTYYLRIKDIDGYVQTRTLVRVID